MQKLSIDTKLDFLQLFNLRMCGGLNVGSQICVKKHLILFLLSIDPATQRGVARAGFVETNMEAVKSEKEPLSWLQ